MPYAIVFVSITVIFWFFTFIVVKGAWKYGFKKGYKDAQLKWRYTHDIDPKT